MLNKKKHCYYQLNTYTLAINTDKQNDDVAETVIQNKNTTAHSLRKSLCSAECKYDRLRPVLERHNKVYNCCYAVFTVNRPPGCRQAVPNIVTSLPSVVT